MRTAETRLRDYKVRAIKKSLWEALVVTAAIFVLVGFTCYALGWVAIQAGLLKRD